jgi:hypothetical protein
MFGRPAPVKYAGRFQFALENAGNFKPPPRSMFNDKDELKKTIGKIENAFGFVCKVYFSFSI